MSYGIMPYSVSIDRLKQAIGSNDAALAKSLKDRLRDSYDFDSDDDEVTPEQAVDQLISGSELQKGYGHYYGTVIELLSLQFGKMLENGAFSGMSSSWADEVDQALEDAGVPAEILRVTDHLMYRSSPVTIPPPDDFPSIGYLTKSEIPAALQAMQSADMDSADDEQKEAMIQLKNWLEICSKASTDLVCFYH